MDGADRRHGGPSTDNTADKLGYTGPRHRAGRGASSGLLTPDQLPPPSGSGREKTQLRYGKHYPSQPSTVVLDLPALVAAVPG